MNRIVIALAMSLCVVSQAAIASANSLIVSAASPVQSARNDRSLPNTAGNVPLMLLIGFGSLGIAFGLTIWTRRAVIRPRRAAGAGLNSRSSGSPLR